MSDREQAPRQNALLEVRDLRKHYRLGGGLFGGGATLRAVDGVSFDIDRGEVLGLVGESGSGKTTVGRTVLRLNQPTAGTIGFDGTDITTLSRQRLRPLRRHMQLIFQDPYASLSPRMRVSGIVGAPLAIHEPALSPATRDARVQDALALVGLPPGAADRFPHEFSGGQRQRIGIARALILRPLLLVADEPVSALDVSIQAQVVNLLLDIRARLGLAMLFIGHDLAVVGHLSDRVAVMYLGRIVEIAPTRALFTRPRHPYTEALFAASPIPDPRRRADRLLLGGDIPSPVHPPSGCAFRTRCVYAQPACAIEAPALREVTPGHFKACRREDLDLTPWPDAAVTARTPTMQEAMQ